MLTTAAGTITPARVLIIGVRSRGTCRRSPRRKRLGAVVSAYDLRPAVKEQVQSLGGRFVELPIEAKDAQDARGYATAQDEAFYARQRELLGRVVGESDVVITAAVVPGKKSPVLVTAEMVQGMAAGLGDRGSGGRARRKLRADALGRNNRTCNGVTIIGRINLASTVPYHASQMYARNLTAFLLLLVKKGKLD